MTKTIGTFVTRNRRFVPIFVTAALFFVAYAFGAIVYPGMRDPQVFLNLFRTSPFLLISAIGMTLVILSGGIDLSVSGVVALTTVASAALLRTGEWNPWVVMLLMLAMGMALGTIMGIFITYLKVQPFIATLAGMWFARGLCFFISDDAIPINNRVYRILGQTKILIPGLSDPQTQQGPFISILVVVSLLVLVVAIYVTQYTRFGRTVYAIGGNEGRNEQSARLMGLPVNRTKVLVYTLNGFCSALAGIALSIDVSSGHGLYASGFELIVISAVVMGGTMLTGGVGYVFGTLFGVLITCVIQTLIQFNGKLSSWWTNIVVGVLTLVFIGVQRLLASQKARQTAAAGPQDEEAVPVTQQKAGVGRRMLLWGGGAIVVVVLVVLAIIGTRNATNGSAADTPVPTSSKSCELKPMREDQATSLIADGAVVAYERNGGPNCIDELYAIYPDGRIVGDSSGQSIEEQVDPAEVEQLLSGIRARGWFTDEMYSTWHVPCAQCFSYFIMISDQGQEKAVQAVDGGTDAPANYWQVVSLINGVIPHFSTAP